MKNIFYKNSINIYTYRGDSVKKIRKGDIVTRKSYNNDVFFWVKDIVMSIDKLQMAILKGVTLRIEASAYINDLELVDKSFVYNELRKFEDNINSKANILIDKYKRRENSRKDFIRNNAVILHLDGDKRYAEKSSRVYEKFKLKAIVKNIRENRQPYEIVNLLNKYNPDILIITGHDGMIKKGYRYNDIYNYRNSKYFVKTVEESRKWEQGENKLTIFAGACQSYYEAIMEAGANFASSPARILIDFMDPLIIAQKIATTSRNTYVRINDIQDNLRDGTRGVGGIGSFGKKQC